jgi:hypothetical protein
MEHEQVINNEVHENYKFFEKKLPELMNEHTGEYVLIRHKNIIAYFPTISEAYWYGRKNYSDGIYSIQEIKDWPIILRNIGHVTS